MQINTTFFKLNKISILLTLASLLFYFSFAYNLVRTDYIKLLTLYIALFVVCYKLIQIVGYNFKFLLVTAILSRLIFIVATPNLSQDFYRFIWDGYLNQLGINPYLYSATEIVNQNLEQQMPNQQQLYDGMGWLSQGNNSNYPPINQLFFVLGNWFPGSSILSSIIGMRICIILADIGVIFYGRKLLKAFQLPEKSIFLYALNPLIIIELTGNLHFESIMIFFIIFSLYLLHKGKWFWSAICFAFAISTKLIPVLLFPFFIKWFLKHHNLKSLIGFYAVVGITVLLLFLPFISSDFISNYANTTSLWFNNFEFNASIYYIARTIGYSISGYNQIAIIGKCLALLIFIIVWSLALFRKVNNMQQLIVNMLLGLTVYFLLSTTVHPWYLATLVLFSAFSNYKYPLIWSIVIILSYLAYANADNIENLWLVALEYAVVFLFMIGEFFNLKPFRNIKI
ncbi:glycosyltransferase 87 family protein [Mesoflavibacter sp. CH_XMU1404-2]|uniref:glycosyltransferase family 87 protein n=1 Tax=Mesoflavibacter sp. CH_XMU1404-2 TaxID=3107766 RepID=UPI00300AF576